MWVNLTKKSKDDMDEDDEEEEQEEEPDELEPEVGPPLLTPVSEDASQSNCVAFKKKISSTVYLLLYNAGYVDMFVCRD